MRSFIQTIRLSDEVTTYSIIKLSPPYRVQYVQYLSQTGVLADDTGIHEAIHHGTGSGNEHLEDYRHFNSIYEWVLDISRA